MARFSAGKYNVSAIGEKAGVTPVDGIMADGKYYAYSCGNELSQLYLVEGLR